MDNNYPSFPEDPNKPSGSPSQNSNWNTPNNNQNQGYQHKQIPQNDGPTQFPNSFSPPPENYLVWAILSTVLCCMPLGIVAIVKSSQVNTKWFIGDREGALKDAKSAKNWAIWSAGVSIVLFVLYIAFMVLFQIFVVSSTSSSRFDYY